MAIPFLVSPGSSSPIFKQIVDQIRIAIVTRRLLPGTQLPTVRSLAEQLVVNPNTVAKAYGELARDGMIDSQQGRGVFVARQRQIYSKAERFRRIQPLVEALAIEGTALGFSSDELVEFLKRRIAEVGGGRRSG